VRLSLAGAAACTSHGSSGTGPPPDPCAPTGGTYAIHTTKDPASSTGCPDVPDEDRALDPNVLFGGVRDDDAGPGCTVTKDAKTCTVVVHCVDMQDGFTSSTDQTISTASASYQGTSESRTTGGDAGANVDCKYAFTAVKQ
jgi:hypothetical protein